MEAVRPCKLGDRTVRQVAKDIDLNEGEDQSYANRAERKRRGCELIEVAVHPLIDPRNLSKQPEPPCGSRSFPTHAVEAERQFMAWEEHHRRDSSARTCSSRASFSFSCKGLDLGIDVIFEPPGEGSAKSVWH
jgi:hypothetical protein